MVICLQRGADLHMAQLMPLPLTVSCFSKFKIGFTFLVPAHLGSPGQRAVKRVCVLVTESAFIRLRWLSMRHCPHLLVARRLQQVRHAAIHPYLRPTRRSAANPTTAVATVNRWDRQTDGRSTVSHKLDSVCVYVKSSARLESEVWAVARWQEDSGY